MVERNHPAEKMGLWLPKGGTTWEEQIAYVESDKGVLADVLPLEVTQAHLDKGGYLRNDCALALAFTEALGYEVVLVGEYLFPIGKLGFEPKYVDEAINAANIWGRNYALHHNLEMWWRQDCRNKKWGSHTYNSEPVSPITVGLGKASPFGVWFLNILEEV